MTKIMNNDNKTPLTIASDRQTDGQLLFSLPLPLSSLFLPSLSIGIRFFLFSSFLFSLSSIFFHIVLISLILSSYPSYILPYSFPPPSLLFYPCAIRSFLFFSLPFLLFFTFSGFFFFSPFCIVPDIFPSFFYLLFHLYLTFLLSHPLLSFPTPSSIAF